MCSFAELLLAAQNGCIHHIWAFSRERRRNHGLTSPPSLQVFQDAANLFLDLLGKLLTQPDDSEQTWRRDSLTVIGSHFHISVSPVFLRVSPIPNLMAR